MYLQLQPQLQLHKLPHTSHKVLHLTLQHHNLSHTLLQHHLHKLYFVAPPGLLNANHAHWVSLLLTFVLVINTLMDVNQQLYYHHLQQAVALNITLNVYLVLKARLSKTIVTMILTCMDAHKHHINHNHTNHNHTHQNQLHSVAKLLKLHAYLVQPA